MDSKSLALSLIVVLGCLSVLSWLVARRRDDYALRFWAWGLAGSSLGFLFLLLQTVWPSPLFQFLGSALLLSYAASLPLGLRLFFQRARLWPIRFSVYMVLWGTSALAFIFLWPSYQFRSISVSLCMSLFCIEFFIVLLAERNRIPRPLRYLLGLCTLGFVAFQIIRSALVLVSSAPSLFADELLSSLTFLVTLAAGILWMGGLILLDSQRLLSIIREDSEELQRLNLLKDRVLAMTGHDLRGPLGNLKLIWGELAARAREGKPIDIDPELMVLVDRSLAGTQDLLENLFSFAEVQRSTAHTEPVSLALAVTSVVDLWAPAARTKKILLTAEKGPDVMALASPEGITAVLRNLVGNAVKFTPTGGSVTVRWGESPEGTFVEVVDTGIGMDLGPGRESGELSRRSSRPGTAGERGSGFGLVLVRELVAAWGATLTLDSAPGQGTKVRIVFPP